jgi:integrase
MTGKSFSTAPRLAFPFYVPIPPDIAEVLRALPSSNPCYFFWSGNGDPRPPAKDGTGLLEIANIRKPDETQKCCHAHMFRDTFAVELLNKGVPIDRVSLLLAH